MILLRDCGNVKDADFRLYRDVALVAVICRLNYFVAFYDISLILHSITALFRQ